MLEVERRGFTLENVTLASVCASYVAWVLSLPMFPTQDGPMHLYYAHVMSALLGHGPEVYGHFYRIKHLLPPYSAYYYLLIGLSRFVPLFLADKLVICGYMVSFLYGFRYLARAVGPVADQATLLATLLMLNWPLGMGFVNFCLGVSLALWTLGVWMRSVGRPDLGRKALFVAMCVGLVFVHPVPLLAVLGYCTLDVIARFLSRGRIGRVTRADALCVLLALTTLGYIKLFTIAHVSQQMLPDPISPMRLLLQNTIAYARGRGIGFFVPTLHTPLDIRVYRAMLVALVPLSLAVALRRLLTKRRRLIYDAGTHWFGLTLLMIVALPFVPHDINASHFFADRLLLFLFIGALLAFAGSTGFPGTGTAARVAIAIYASFAMALTLSTANRLVRPSAITMAGLERMPHLDAGSLGIALADSGSTSSPIPGLAFNPFLWGSVNYIRHYNAVLYNTPWMDLAVIPLGSRAGLADEILGPNEVESPWLLRRTLEGSLSLDTKVLSRLDFAVINHVDVPPTKQLDKLLLNQGTGGWSCSEEEGWFSLCRRMPIALPHPEPPQSHP